MAVLRQLSQEMEPVSLRDLLKKMEKKYFERSLRRWLAEMVEDGSVELLGRKRATKYQAVQGERGCFGSESIRVIERLRRPLYERLPAAYADEWFNAYQPKYNFLSSCAS
jgi:hypothetical protein